MNLKSKTRIYVIYVVVCTTMPNIHWHRSRTTIHTYYLWWFSNFMNSLNIKYVQWGIAEHLNPNHLEEINFMSLISIEFNYLSFNDTTHLGIWFYSLADVIQIGCIYQIITYTQSNGHVFMIVRGAGVNVTTANNMVTGLQQLRHTTNSSHTSSKCQTIFSSI